MITFTECYCECFLVCVQDELVSIIDAAIRPQGVDNSNGANQENLNGANQDRSNVVNQDSSNGTNADHSSGANQASIHELVHPLIVSEDVYNTVKDVFLNGKSFKDVNTSCVELFASYPPTEEYPILGMIRLS